MNTYDNDTLLENTLRRTLSPKALDFILTMQGDMRLLNSRTTLCAAIERVAEIYTEMAKELDEEYDRREAEDEVFGTGRLPQYAKGDSIAALRLMACNPATIKASRTVTNLQDLDRPWLGNTEAA